MASFGALITVISLAFDPFMQQVILYKPRLIHSANTTIDRSQYWHDTSDSWDENGVTLALRAALYSGVLNGDELKPFKPTCSTGNCTWDPVSSLALCSKCGNVDPKTATSCHLDWATRGEDISYTTRQCNFTISDYSINFDTPGFVAYYQTNGNTNGYSVALASSLTPVTDHPVDVELVGQRSPLAGFARAILGDAAQGSLDITNLTVCALMPCLKTYNVSVTDGVLETTELDTWRFQGWSRQPGWYHLPSPPGGMMKGTTNKTFAIEVTTGWALMYLLDAAFNGSVSAPFGTGIEYTSDIMQAVYQTDDLGHLMDNVAASPV